MIKMLTASTLEIDDIQLALSEIHAQLHLPENLQKNAIGLLACHTEFVESGVVKALCESLPFDVIGATTLASGTEATSDEMQLSLCVIMGDDITFRTGVSAPLLSDDMMEPLRDVYRQASCDALRPAILFSYMPLLPEIAGELIWQQLNAVAGGDVPIFGTLACDHTVDLSKSVTIYNGETYRDALVMACMYGDIHPRFLVASMSGTSMQRQRAIITESDGYLLKRVNHMPTLQYMKTLGLLKNDGLEALRSLPFIIDYNDGTPPVARAILGITEEGYAIGCGFMPVDAALSIATVQAGEVLQTTRDITTASMEAMDDIHGMLMFPCVVRNYVLAGDTMSEIRQAQAALGKRYPAFISYSGGELCPVYGQEGQIVNRFHNYSLIACVF